MLVGTTGQGPLAPSSDYDLVIVLTDGAPPLQGAVMHVDGRLGDMLFATTAEIGEITAGNRVFDPEEWPGRIARLLESGRIAFDRHGNLARAQGKMRAGCAVSETPRDSADTYWDSVNYNLRHNRRMLSSSDEVYRTALDVRLLHALADLFVGYFMMRGLPWYGEKAAVRYLKEHEPDFLSLFECCVAEGDRERKFELYEELCGRATAPVGGLWAPTDMSVKLRPGAAIDARTEAEALDFLERLVAPS